MAQYKYPNYEELDITTKAWLMDEIAKENGIDEVQDYISNWIANNVFPETEEDRDTYDEWKDNQILKEIE